MPNPFSLNVITSAGANLIAQATAANPIVFVDALSGTQSASSNADLASKDASFYNGITGTIQASSATNNVAKIVVRFGNAGENPQAVKSVCLRGRLANQNDSQAVIVSAMSDANSEIVIPSDLSPNQIIRIPFLFAVNTDGIVQTVYADGATMADLERFVSLHKAGNPNEGDAQTIRGEKTFHEDVYARLDIHVAGEIYGNSVQVGTIITNAEGIFGGDVYITSGGLDVEGNIEPGEGISASIGSQGYPFASAYVGQLVMTAGRIYMPVTGSIQHAGSIEFSHNTAVNQASVYGGNARLLLNTGVSDNQSLINLTVDGQKGLQITYSTQISDYQLSVTTARMNVTSDFVTFSANTSVTISGNATINSLSVNALTGTQPTYSGSTTTVKVGSIVMAWVRPNLVSGNYFRAGQAYHSSGTSSDTSTTLEIAESANNTFKRSTYSRILPNGIYAFLSDVDNSVATCTLVQCLSLD